MVMTMLLLTIALCVEAASFGNKDNSGTFGEGNTGTPGTSFDKGNSASSGASFGQGNSGTFGEGNTGTPGTAFDKGNSASSGASFGQGNSGKKNPGMLGTVSEESNTFHTPDQQAIRNLFLEYETVMSDSDFSDSDRADYFQSKATPDFFYKFPGDNTKHSLAYFTTYNNLIVNYLIDNADSGREVSTTIGRIEVNGTVGTIDAKHRFKGRVSAPVIGYNKNVDFTRDWLCTYAKQADGGWKSSSISILGDDDDEFNSSLGRQISDSLRDAVISAKQAYPAYNPFLVVGGSVLAVGFATVVAVGVCIVQRRRRYKVVAVSDV